MILIYISALNLRGTRILQKAQSGLDRGDRDQWHCREPAAARRQPASHIAHQYNREYIRNDTREMRDSYGGRDGQRGETGGRHETRQAIENAGAGGREKPKQEQREGKQLQN